MRGGMEVSIEVSKETEDEIFEWRVRLFKRFALIKFSLFRTTDVRSFWKQN